MARQLNRFNLPVVSTLPGSGTAGDEVYLSTDNKVYQWNAGTSTWQPQGTTVNTFTVPTARVYSSTASILTPTASTITPIPFNVEDHDTDSMHDTVTNNTRITIKTPGYYLFTGVVRYTTSTTNEALIRVNGATQIGDAAVTGTNVFLSTVYKCVAGDYVELCALTGTPSAIVGGNTNSTHLTAVWLSAGSNTVTEPGVPAVHIYKTTTTAVPAGGSGIIPVFDSERYDTDNMHDLTVNADRLTCKTPGLYDVWGAIGLSGGGVNVQIVIFKNGTDLVGASNTSTTSNEATVTAQVLLAAGDYLTVRYFATSAVTVPSSSATGLNQWQQEFGAVWQGSGKIVIPTAQVYSGVAQASLASGVEAALTFDTELVDNDNIHSTVSQTSRLTCNTAGTYVVEGTAQYPATNTTGTRGLGVKKNGTTYQSYNQAGALNVAQTLNVVEVLDLAVGDYIELVATQTSGVGVVIPAASAGNKTQASFSMVKVGQSGTGTNNDPGIAQSGTNLYTTNVGNFGVGTSTPSTTLHVNGPARVGTFTVATRPSAATVGAGAIIYVSDGAAGAKFQGSDGTTWLNLG